MLDAVLREELAVLIARQDVILVVLVAASHVGFLDAASGGRIVAGYGEAYHGLVAKGNGLLYKTLAKGAAADDGATVIVLNGTGKNLGSRRRNLVDKHNERQVLVAAAAVAAILLARRLASLRVDDEPVLG